MRRFLAFTVLIVPLLLACKDDPKPDSTKPAATAEPIPSDIVYNSFFASPSAAANLKVAFDGGLDSGGEAVAEGPAGKATVTDPGAEPRARMQYAFAMGKPETVVSTLTIEQGDMGADIPPLKFTFTATPKTRTPDGKTHLELKVTKVELMLGPTAPAELTAQKGAIEKALVGLEAGFDATNSGDLENVAIKADKIPRGAQSLVQVFAGSLEFLLVPLPGAPIGVGAKWSSTSSGGEEGGTLVSNFSLVSRSPTGADIKCDTVRSAPKKAFEDPQAPPGTMIEVKGTGSYTISIRFDGVAQKADGSSTTQVVISAPGQGAQTRSVKQTQSLESK